MTLSFAVTSLLTQSWELLQTQLSEIHSWLHQNGKLLGGPHLPLPEPPIHPPAQFCGHCRRKPAEDRRRIRWRRHGSGPRPAPTGPPIRWRSLHCCLQQVIPQFTGFAKSAFWKSILQDSQSTKALIFGLVDLFLSSVSCIWSGYLQLHMLVL